MYFTTTTESLVCLGSAALTAVMVETMPYFLPQFKRSDAATNYAYIRGLCHGMALYGLSLGLYGTLWVHLW